MRPLLKLWKKDFLLLVYAISKSYKTDIKNSLWEPHHHARGLGEDLVGKGDAILMYHVKERGEIWDTLKLISTKEILIQKIQSNELYSMYHLIHTSILDQTMVVMFHLPCP